MNSRDSFAHTPHPGEDIIVHNCDECIEVLNHFQGHVWSEVSDDVIVSHFDSLPLFSDNAKRYFYPAYLIYSLRHTESTVTQFLLYALASDHRHDPSGGFSEAQIQAILSYLDFLSVSSSEFSSEICEARRYWTQKAEQGAAANP